MTDTIETPAVAKVARHLTEITELYERLLAQAIHKAADPLMPGGEAMNALGGAGSPDDFKENVLAEWYQHMAVCPRLDHTRCRVATHVEDQDGEPILQTILYWTEQWRAEDGYRLERRANLASEVKYLRLKLDWAWRNIVDWEDFAADVSRAKTRLENLLYAGIRAEKGAPCIHDSTTLQRKHEPYRGPDGGKAWRLSDWFCRTCHRTWDEDDYARMVTAANEATKVELVDGETWVSVDYAARKVGRPESTIRVWIHRGELPTACIITGRRDRFVRMADVEARNEKITKRKGAAV